MTLCFSSVELASHAISWLSFAAPALALNRKPLWSLPAHSDGLVYSTEKLGEKEDLARDLFFVPDKPETEKVWDLKIAQLLALQGEDAKKDPTKMMVANATAPLFNIKRSGKRSVAPQVVSEFASLDTVEKAVKEWISFQPSSQPAGSVAINILTVISSRELNDIANTVKEKFPTQKVELDFYRETAALLWRKIGVGFGGFDNINEFAVALASRTNDPVDFDKGAEQVRAEISVFAEAFDLSWGFEAFWISLSHIIRIGVQWAYEWAKQFNEGTTPSTAFACANLMDWFNPPYIPRYDDLKILPNTRKMLNDIGDLSFWLIYATEPIQYMLLPEKVTNPDQVRYLLKLARVIAKSGHEEEKTLKSLRNLEAEIEKNWRGNLVPVVKAWDKFIEKVVKAQAHEIEIEERTQVKVFVLPKALKTKKQTLIGHNLSQFIIKSSRVSMIEMVDRYMNWFGTDLVSPDDPDMSHYKWHKDVEPKRSLVKNEKVSGPLLDVTKLEKDPDACAFIGCNEKSCGVAPACFFHLRADSEAAMRESFSPLTTLVPRIDGQGVEMANERLPAPRPRVTATPKLRARLMLEIVNSFRKKTGEGVMPIYHAKLLSLKFATGGKFTWEGRMVAESDKTLNALRYINDNYDKLDGELPWRTARFSQVTTPCLFFILHKTEGYSRVWEEDPFTVVNINDRCHFTTARNGISKEYVKNTLCRPPNFDLADIKKRFNAKMHLPPQGKQYQFPEFTLIREIERDFPTLKIAILVSPAYVDFAKKHLAKSPEASSPPSKVAILTQKMKDKVLGYYEKWVGNKMTTFLHPQIKEDDQFPSPPRPGTYAWSTIFRAACHDESFKGLLPENLWGPASWNPAARSRSTEADREERAADFAAFLIEWRAREGLHLVEVENLDFSYAAKPKTTWAPMKEEYFVITVLTTSLERRLGQIAARIRAVEHDFIWFSDIDSSILRNLRKDPNITPELAKAWWEIWVKTFPTRADKEKYRMSFEYWNDIFCTRSFAKNPEDRHKLQPVRSEHPVVPEMNPYFHVKNEFLLHGRERIAEYDVFHPTPIPSLASSTSTSRASSRAQSPTRTTDEGRDARASLPEAPSGF
ncbi:Oidioi.mRNA.OKI2018_I69.YSR.g17088.t1.cds [Oikopleura dioica]|uniref:Oidioi.mRNA.OKI2018_I69.YSR.g17088.t1.cds n=1 Tax=Oikopleura dioica TaxID=34765 RepID=A0ABN7SI60_OIKDI|nr:Oidioi.mRNA.OKI2018_I69.YSR.g17088.t1.cds [Oikopleura dioica]